jgi:uncharacterized protein (DUF362 family)
MCAVHFASGQEIVEIRRVGISLNDDEVEEEVYRAVESIGGIPKDIETAKSIMIKPNIGASDVREHKGRQIALTEPCVTRAVLSMIREVNDNDVFICDAPAGGLVSLAEKLGYNPMAKEFKTRFVDLNEGPYVEIEVPNPLNSKRYYVNKNAAKADAIISIAKLKAHIFAGVSLCMKNLFGIPPNRFYGVVGRTYLHYPFRLPRCIVDLTSAFKPCLNIIEGIVGEDFEEWTGPMVETEVLVTGTNPVAVDATGARLMGFNPEADFPKIPFLFDMNHIKLANIIGLGPIKEKDIEVIGEDLDTQKIQFHKKLPMSLPSRFHLEARNQISQDAEYYWNNLDTLVKAYKGKYVGILEGKVLWSAETMRELPWRVPFFHTVRKKGAYKVPFIKKVYPKDEDPELREVFSQP